MFFADTMSAIGARIYATSACRSTGATNYFSGIWWRNAQTDKKSASPRRSPFRAAAGTHAETGAGKTGELEEELLVAFRHRFHRTSTPTREEFGGGGRRELA
jgi:hypothetical protein